jgi:hypothetical protein
MLTGYIEKSETREMILVPASFVLPAAVDHTIGSVVRED